MCLLGVLIMPEKQKALHECRALKDAMQDCKLLCMVATFVDLKPDARQSGNNIKHRPLEVICQ